MKQEGTRGATCIRERARQLANDGIQGERRDKEEERRRDSGASHNRCFYRSCSELLRRCRLLGLLQPTLWQRLALRRRVCALAFEPEVSVSLSPCPLFISPSFREPFEFHVNQQRGRFGKVGSLAPLRPLALQAAPSVIGARVWG